MNEPQFQHIAHSSGIMGAVASMIGGRNENQDSFLVGETPIGLIVIVCDGMGGGPAGKTASSIAAETMLSYASQADATMDPGDVLRVVAKAANEAVLEAAAANPALRGMGTTCVAVIINAGKGYIVHVGDSRCYQIRGGKQVFRTADHSYVAEMVRKGTITEEEARNSNYSNVITQAIGGSAEVMPEVDVVSVKPGDRFALMTDGIWGAAPEPELVAALAAPRDVATVVEHIATTVDRMGFEKGGGHDNLTLAMIELPAVETVAPIGGVAEAVAVTDEGWQITDNDDPTGGYVIEDDAAEISVGKRTLAEKIAEERAKRGESTVNEKTGKKVEKKEEQKGAVKGEGKPEPGKQGAGVKGGGAKGGKAGKGEKGKKDIRIVINRKSMVYFLIACLVVGIAGYGAGKYFKNRDKDEKELLAEKLMQNGQEGESLGVDEGEPEGEGELGEGEDMEEGKSVDKKENKGDGDKGKEEKKGKEGEKKEEKDPTVSTKDAIDAILKEKDSKDTKYSKDSKDSKKPEAKGKESLKNESLEVIKNAISELKKLKDEKGEELRREKDPEKFKQREQDRQRRMNAVIKALENCRRSLPDDKAAMKAKLDEVTKGLKSPKALKIDDQHGHPRQDTKAYLGSYIDKLEGMVKSAK